MKKALSKIGENWIQIHVHLVLKGLTDFSRKESSMSTHQNVLTGL